MGTEQDKSTQLITGRDLSVRRDLTRLRLLVVDGPDAGRFCDLGAEPVWVGTDPGSDLVLVDTTVSRRHLQARKQDEGAWIQDQDSTNGTFFEGSRIKEMVVGVGRSLRVGNTLVKVVPREESLYPEPSKEPEFFGVLGKSQRMREIFSTLSDVAATELTVLIEGETGTGKEALAEAIHRASSRNQGPFEVIDCTTIPSDLAESHLFGHCKGAFTGAVADRTGCFALASGGTIFIDEVGDLPAQLQPKLLRVLERRQVRPVGSSKSVDVDVRVIAATNKNLKEEASNGNFREDLYYRLAVIAVRLPPLRERIDDLPLLMEHFVQTAASSADWPEVSVPASALSGFLDYPWPGNVRELRNMVERAIALHRTQRFDLETFLAEIARGLGEHSARSQALPFKQAKSQVVDAFEKAYLTDLIQRHEGNVSSASREARLDRHHLTDLLKKHGIKTR
jgi:DNA-binding NtrC family response regulator